MTLDKNNQPRLFVINLDRSPDRRQFMSEQFSRLRLHFEFCRAVDGGALTERDLAPYDREKRWRAFGCDLTANEIGCYLSHYRLYERIVEEKIPRAVILEDDTELSDDFPAIVHRGIRDSGRG